MANTRKAKKKTTDLEKDTDQKDLSKNPIVQISAYKGVLLPIDEGFDYSLGEKSKPKRIATPRIDPLPTDKILRAIDKTFETKQQRPDIQGMNQKQGIILSGMLLAEIIASLPLIVPDEYVPKGKTKKDLKTQYPKSWKTKAINSEHIQNKMKQLLADGEIMTFRVDGKYIFANPKTFGLTKEAYFGSIWHILQIRKYMFQSTRWESSNGKKGYDRFFIPNPFFDETFTRQDLEAFLTLKEEQIFEAWTPEGWDLPKIRELISD